MNARAAIFTTYAAQASAFVAETDQIHGNLAYARQAGAYRSRMQHYAAKADTEAANVQRICSSLTEYEKAAPVRAIEWDELHDFLDHLRAGLEMRYDDCDEMDDVRESFKRLQRDLCELENVKSAADALAAFTDARIKECKEAA